MNSSLAVVRVGVGCIVTSVQHKNCVLVGFRKGSHGAGRLAFPGGHLEVGESWETCAMREVKEETALDIAHVTHVATTNNPFIDGNPCKHYITIFMAGRVTASSPPLENLEPEKCVEWEWMEWCKLYETLETTPNQLFDPLASLLRSMAMSELTGKLQGSKN